MEQPLWDGMGRNVWRSHGTQQKSDLLVNAQDNMVVQHGTTWYNMGCTILVVLKRVALSQQFCIIVKNTQQGEEGTKQSPFCPWLVRDFRSLFLFIFKSYDVFSFFSVRRYIGSIISPIPLYTSFYRFGLFENTPLNIQIRI